MPTEDEDKSEYSLLSANIFKLLASEISNTDNIALNKEELEEEYSDNKLLSNNKILYFSVNRPNLIIRITLYLA